MPQALCCRFRICRATALFENVRSAQSPSGDIRFVYARDVSIRSHFIVRVWSALAGIMISRGVPVAMAQGDAALPAATTPSVAKKGLRLPDIQLHDPWMIADRARSSRSLRTPTVGQTSAHSTER
jgi:hypothetical protein